MNFLTDPALMVTWLAAGLRCYGFFATAPVISRQIPARLRLAFSLILAFVVTPLAVENTVVPTEWWGFSAMVASEAILGLTMGWMALMVFSAVNLAGTIMGFQIGTGISALFDPQTGTQSSEIARLMTSFIGLAVVVAGGHNLLIRGLLTSFSHVPVGGHWMDPQLSIMASNLMNGVLLAGCEMAMPVVGATMLSTLAIALATKAAPQLNVYFAVGILLNLVLGLVALMVVLRDPMGGIDQFLGNLYRAVMLPLGI